MAEGMVSGVCINEACYTVILVENMDPGKPLKMWGLPGGVIEGDETPEETLCREWAEEVDNEEFGPLSCKIVAEIPRHGQNGDYIQYVCLVSDNCRKLRKTGVENETGPPVRISLTDVVSGKVRVFRNHLPPIIHGLKIFTEDQTLREIQRKLELRFKFGREMRM